MPQPIPFLLGPKHLHPRVNTAQDYADFQVRFLANLMSQFPNMPRPGVHAYEGPARAAHVANGSWQVPCECGGVTLVSIEWQIARCPECGAVLEPPLLVIPEFHAEIEQLLALRPMPNRCWLPDETLDDLRAQNAEHGIS